MDNSNGLVDIGANSISIDFEKNIWITNFRGISKLVSRRFGNFFMRNGLLENEVASILEYSPGQFVLGHNKGLTFMETKPFQGNTFRHLSLAGKISGDFFGCRILDLAMDSKQTIWAAADGAGLLKLGPGYIIMEYNHAHGLNFRVTSVLIDSSDTMWIGGTAGIFKRKGQNFIPIPTGILPKPSVRKIFLIDFPEHRSLFLGTHDAGVYEQNQTTGQWTHYRLPDGDAGNRIYSVFLDSSNRVLVGTFAGLYQLDRKDKSLSPFIQNNFLIRQPVYFIQQDRKKQFWFGTNKGVIKWDGKISICYEVSQGLSGQETNRDAGVVDSSGKIWIGTNRGLSVYNEEFDYPSIGETPPKITLLNIKANDRDVSFNETKAKIHLNSDIQSVVFDFLAISFIDERSIRFQYKLAGFDDDWIQGTRFYIQSVRYSNLQPGAYRFFVKAQNAMGKWSEAVKSPEIIIPTPIHQTPWFIFFIIVAFIIVLFLILRFITQRRYAKLLEKQVTERTNQLKLTEKKLLQAQKMEAIGTLAGGIAHDFNNILGVIVGYTELLVDDLSQDSLEYHNAKQVLTASNRATELVKQILAFSRQDERQRKPLDLSLIIDEALKLLRSSLPSSIDIQTDISPGIGLVLADPTQMHQVLMNLCANAAHAMDKKGGTLIIRLKEVLLDEQDVKKYHNIPPGIYLCLSVSDTGHGIPKVVMERIFDPYFTTKGAGEGTGLGLAVIHGIIKNHGGDISVYSETGKGTTFHIFLPRVEKDRPVKKEETAIPAIPTGSGKILLVDDEPALIEVGTQILKRLGYMVTGKSNPLDALEHFESQPEAYDLVITDLTMPDLSGLELAQKVKALKPGIPVILCSGFGAAISREDIDDKVDGFVMKPIIKSELAKEVHRVTQTSVNE
jgi:signal transduction histidine kinase